MRIAAFALTLLSAAAASGLTVDFDNLPGLTPIAYVPKAEVPTSARLDSLDVPGGGRLTFRTSDAAKYVALVSLNGHVGIAPVSKKGKIKQGRLIDIRIKDAPDASIERLTVAGTFRAEGAPETDPYAGGGVWVANAKGQRYPPSGGSYGVSVTNNIGELSLVTLPDPIVRLRVGNGNIFLDQLVVVGDAPAGVAVAEVDVPEPAPLALLFLALGALGLRRR